MKRFFNRKTKRQQGGSLLAVIVASAIGLIVTVSIGKTLVFMFKGMQFAEGRAEFEAIRQMLAADVDCDGTMNGVNVATECTSSSGTQDVSGTRYLRLRRSVTGAGVHYFSQSLETSGNFINAGRIGNHYVKATCSAAEQSLVIKVARADGAGGFATDPLTGAVQNWSNAKSLIYGTGAGVPICFGKSKGVKLNNGPSGELSCVEKIDRPLSIFSANGSNWYYCDGQTSGTGTASLPNTFIVSASCASDVGLTENYGNLNTISCIRIRPTDPSLFTHINPEIRTLCCEFK